MSCEREFDATIRICCRTGIFSLLFLVTRQSGLRLTFSCSKSSHFILTYFILLSAKYTSNIENWVKILGHTNQRCYQCVVMLSFCKTRTIRGETSMSHWANFQFMKYITCFHIKSISNQNKRPNSSRNKGTWGTLNKTQKSAEDLKTSRVFSCKC